MKSCALIFKKDQTQGVILFSLRHKDALARAKKSRSLAKDSLQKNLSPEFAALDLKAALDAVEEVAGKTVTNDILNKILRNSVSASRSRFTSRRKVLRGGIIHKYLEINSLIEVSPIIIERT